MGKTQKHNNEPSLIVESHCVNLGPQEPLATLVAHALFLFLGCTAHHITQIKESVSVSIRAGLFEGWLTLT